MRMFTGIIEEIGIVKQVVHKKNLAVLTVDSGKIARGIKLGSSICVDGVCLTVCRIKAKLISFDIMLETLSKTSLGGLSKGSTVNLERALKLSSRLDGHLVSGHVDQVSRLRKKISKENYLELQFDLDKKISKYVVPKGSISINGVSLTVGKVTKNMFSVYIIPVTEKETNLGQLSEKQHVNIEVDLLARYLEKQIVK